MSFGCSIRKISYHLPEKIERNDQLKILHPEWDIDNVCNNEYPITKYQPKYFIINNFKDVKVNIRNIVSETI